jgi:hypothetical protein
MDLVGASLQVPARPHPWALRAIIYFLTVIMCLTGPAFIVAGVVNDELPITIVGIVLSVPMILFGIVISRWVAHEHAQTLRLQERGVPASAEILAITPTFGEESGLALRMRFTGPHVTPFEAVYTCADDSSLSVGDRLGAIVDPVTNVFAIPNRR